MLEPRLVLTSFSALEPAGFGESPWQSPGGSEAMPQIPKSASELAAFRARLEAISALHGHGGGQGNGHGGGQNRPPSDGTAWQGEAERQGQHSNDTPNKAELLRNLGTRPGNVSEVSILGSLRQTAREVKPREDDGSISRANATGLVAGQDGTIVARGRIGDGPHGSGGTRKGDYDYYKLSVKKGQMISVNVEGESLDPATGLADMYANRFNGLVALYDSAGGLVTFNDNLDSYSLIYEAYGLYDSGGAHYDPGFRFAAPATGDYYLAVASSAFDPFNVPAVLQASPFDSASGVGVRTEGNYQLSIVTETPRRVELNAEETAAGSAGNGDIPTATDTGLVAGQDGLVYATGRIGDGPFGSAGTGTGDFDMFRFAVSAGQKLTISAITDSRLNSLAVPKPDGTFSTLGMDTFLTVYDEQGNGLFAVNDAFNNDASFELVAQVGGVFYVAVSGYAPVYEQNFLANPLDESTGTTYGTEGDYTLMIRTEARPDRDAYSVDLRAGDVLSVAAVGGNELVQLFDPQGRQLQMSIYSTNDREVPESPLIHDFGEEAFNRVIAEAGRYTVVVGDAMPAPYTFAYTQAVPSPYNLRLAVNRPGLESQPVGAHQVVFLDFDGFTTADLSQNGWLDRFGITPTVDTFSPFAAYLDDVGLSPAADESVLIDKILAFTVDRLATDLSGVTGRGKNGDFTITGRAGEFQIEILNSRDHADPYGLYPNVSRLFVGTDAVELGYPGILGIANSLDVGNYDLNDQAVVLAGVNFSEFQAALDRDEVVLDPSKTRLDYFAYAIGKVVVHEVGHNLGAWHTDEADQVYEIMDGGGATVAGFLQNHLGLGPDNVFGNANDVPIRFQPDSVFSQFEGKFGVSDSLNTSAFGLSTGTKSGAYFDFVTGSLYVTGTMDDGKNDKLEVKTVGANLKVTINNATVLTRPAAGVSRVVLNGSSDADTLDASGYGGPATLLGKGGKDTLKGGGGDDQLFGGADDDRLEGGEGRDVLVGGAGSDSLGGGGGTDVLIGGNGADDLQAGNGGDLLVGGRTVFDEQPAALAQVLAEWASSRTYEARVANLRGTGAGPRLNGDTFLTMTGSPTTVFADSKQDKLTGGNGRDWFFAVLAGKKKDTINGLANNEWIESVAPSA